MKGQWVEIEFDCLPLRSVSRLDVPLDASPKYEQFVQRVKAAMTKHGSHNSYYLHRGSCTYHLTNAPDRGEIAFAFEGTALTGSNDRRTRSVDLSVTLRRETCGWLSEPIVQFFAESVQHAILVEFDRYIEAGDLSKTEERMKKLAEQNELSEGFVGMYL
ncbi:hypothetical protein FYK55_11425 [Roseiconus nitratireducens]|uniref:Uncharacterized protein n=1 Tax=Roseiconus nitratireducens TaxID=2605748 RepID=A0A5M6DBK2_9BACT|nr:hypothetical protein [Roseiconus nitratireducens]KAA5543780.1 hypothetical protein FYK55_11425 [Roseiconus nitratireducens]